MGNSHYLNIKKIEIEELFGVYTYSIYINEQDISKLLILYGDNGVGKTTILQIIFNLLSAETSQGHKTELANIKFKKITISLSNGYIVIAEREKDLIGDYQLRLMKGDKELKKANTHSIEEQGKYVIRGSASDTRRTASYKDDVDEFLLELKKLNLTIHYLADSRKVKSNANVLLNESKDEMNISNMPIEFLRKVGRSRGEDTFLLSDTLLEVAISMVTNWFKKQAFVANSIGQDSINSIYLNLAEQLLSTTKKNAEPVFELITKVELVNTLKTLKQRNLEFIKYQLTTDFGLNKLTTVVEKAPKGKIELISSVLRPYVSSIEKKLNALESTRNIINIFITTLNTFYIGKKLEFSIDSGLKIISTYNNNEILSPTMLSSGEKQLLLLFCNTITAREGASIFIIDEPELSLNVKWQRKLIDALLSLAEGSSIQFIFASHSVELLSKFTLNVCQLKNIRDF